MAVRGPLREQMKVVSGGQTGSDFAGLRAAKVCGLETGGWLPKGCRTLQGPRPDLITEYGMQEHSSESYARRTEQNVKESDGTVRFARTFKSRGEVCTLNAIKWFRKPHFDVDISKPPPHEEFVKWLKDNQINILNVAGNSEETAAGIGDFVYEYLRVSFILWSAS